MELACLGGETLIATGVKTKHHLTQAVYAWMMMGTKDVNLGWVVAKL